MPVATGELYEQFHVNSNEDYRRYNIAAPDGNGGVYVCWNFLQSIGSYQYYGVAVQHLHADGSRVFGDAGTIVGQPDGSAEWQSSVIV